jgi:poly(3-hydroxybutyrate) depolymerase
MDIASLIGACAVIAATSGFAPHETKTEQVGERTVVWYEHGTDPAWGASRQFTDKFTVARPVSGDRNGAPLLVQLHGRGGGNPNGGILSLYKQCTDTDSVYACPGDFYVLALDSTRDFNVAANKTHDEFWWGGSHKFSGPAKGDIPRIRKGLTSCEKRVLATVKWVIEKYAIDRDRVYLCGNSMGGQGALAIGLPHGDIFAAVNANVPATIWFPVARMGFVKDDGSDDTAFDASKFPDPPVCVDWSGSDDVWSRDHEILYRNMKKHKFSFMGLWGAYGHCGDVSAARGKNPLIERFDWLSVRKNAAYPVFTDASTDDACPWPFSVWKPQVNTWGGWSGEITGATQRQIAAGAKPDGQVNGYFRWENVSDDASGLAMDLFLAPEADLGVAPPEQSVVDVSIRRVQGRKIAPNQKVAWTFGRKKGFVTADAHGLVTVPKLTVTGEKTRLTLSYGGKKAPKGKKDGAKAKAKTKTKAKTPAGKTAPRRSSRPSK